VGYIDGREARSLAVELFRDYGLDVTADLPIAGPAVRAQLDGADRSRKIGFKLNFDADPSFSTEGFAEPADTELGPAEIEALRQDGWSLIVAPLCHYRNLDGDQLPATFAWLAAVADFLNSVTDGADIDLRGVVLRELRRYPAPSAADLKLSDVPQLEPWIPVEFRIDGTRTLTLHFNEPGSSPRSPSPDEPRVFFSDSSLPTPLIALPTQRRIGMMGLPVQRPGGSQYRARLLQPRGAGQAPLVVEASTDVMFTPSNFDPNLPFDIEITLGAGAYQYKQYLELAGPRP
jgi:hypothetical protein